MCPLYPIHLIFMYATVLIPVWLVCSSSASGSSPSSPDSLSKWNQALFYPNRSDKLVEGSTHQVFWALPENYTDPGASGSGGGLKVGSEEPETLSIHFESSDRQIADVTKNQVVYLDRSSVEGTKLNVSFSVTAKFLGHASIRVFVGSGRNGSRTMLGRTLPVSVVRKDTILDKIFLYSVIGLVSLAYINMGCSLDLKVVWSTIKKPVAPLVGITCQYLCMPLLAFGFSQLLLPSPSLQLGLFVTGCSPGGGASNIWTVLLNGNLNLSITLTFVSTVLALALMPMWIFSLGKRIFEEADLRIPYKNIIYLIVALLVPVSIGVLIRKRFPRLADWLVKLTRPFSLLLIIYIFTFGIYANVYVFYLITWNVVLSSVCLIWFGFAFGYVVARLMKFPVEDIIAIAIETGVQNTGVAILLLKLSLPQPDADMTFVLPIMAATAMPIPLGAALGIIRLRSWYIGDESPSSKVPAPQLEGLMANGDSPCNGNGVGKFSENGVKSLTVETFIKPSHSNGSYVAVGCKDDLEANGGGDTRGF